MFGTNADIFILTLLADITNQLQSSSLNMCANTHTLRIFHIGGSYQSIEIGTEDRNSLLIQIQIELETCPPRLWVLVYVTSDHVALSQVCPESTAS